MIISHLTDVEGNLSYFKRWVARSTQLVFQNGSLSYSNPNLNQKFVHGGDFCDKGPGDLRIGEALVGLKERAPGDTTLIAGNRDIKCRRFTYELNPQFIRERLLHGPSAYWSKVSPRDYVIKQMISEGYSPHSEIDIDHHVQKLGIKACQTLYLKWMLNETMGCGAYPKKMGTFKFRRNELAEITGKPISEINDEMVTQSFIDSVSPNGVVTRYLKQAQLAAIYGETLFIHGAITPENMGYVPGMTEEDRRVTDAKEWLDMLNCWYAKEIKAWLTNPIEDKLTPPGHKPLDDYILFNPKSVVTTNWYQHGKLSPIPESVIMFLNKAGIYRVVSGHQPFSDFPLIIRSPTLEVIGADTSYSDTSAEKDNRGKAIHNLEIHQFDGAGFVSIHAMRKNGCEMALRLPSKSNVSSGVDTPIGHFTSSGNLIWPKEKSLVQCQMDGLNVIEKPLERVPK